MILTAFVCFALLIVAWLIAPGLDRPAPDAVVTEPPTDARIAGARL